MLSVAFVSDFYFPRVGGVELHQHALATGLIRRGHKVIVITGEYGRTGVRFVDGVKVYYLPLGVLVSQTSWPSFVAPSWMLWKILKDENVDIVHGHQSTSSLACESMVIAKSLGLATVFTEHSMFGFADIGSIHLNKVLEFALSQSDCVIAVSKTCKSNVMQRAVLLDEKVVVIPNAVDTLHFKPLERCSRRNRTIVLISRLVYRKGVHLAAKVIPLISKMHPDVHFIIGGDGPKSYLITDMIRNHKLENKVEFIGELNPIQVSSILQLGDVFLNCSLTEAFCIAVLEAASCGLSVVATDVGGVHEVLPESMVKLAKTNVNDIVDKVCEALDELDGGMTPMERHEMVKKMYSWDYVARDTELVYSRVSAMPKKTLHERCADLLGRGFIAGKLYCGVLVLLDILLFFLTHRNDRAKPA